MAGQVQPEIAQPQRGLLYVHPTGHLNDLVVPAGALTCVNAAQVPKLGRYAFEVTDAEIQAAAVIAIDVHWSLALPGFARLVQHIRTLAPQVPVIVGGVTAGHYPQEMLDLFAIDYVLQGDAEPTFAALVQALVAQRPVPADLANLHRRGQPPVAITRMNLEDFNATDCMTASWFPTYQQLGQMDTAAFPAGRTITASRGCAMQCPECVGSHSATFGKGHLRRTPERVAELVRTAAADNQRNLRIFMAKPSATWLKRTIAALYETGPHPLTSAIGLYLCTPPDAEDLQRLDAAFTEKVTVSFVPPAQYFPPLTPEQIDQLEQRWKVAAEAVAGSQNLELDVWTTRPSDLEQTRALLPKSDRVRVSSGAVWQSTRPVDGAVPPFATLFAAMQPVWTFYAAKVLSPSLAKLLAPFQFLDEIDESLTAVPCPAERLSAFHQVMAAAWLRHKLPVFAELQWSLLPVALAPQDRAPPRPPGAQRQPTRTAQDVRLWGAAVLLTPEQLRRGTLLEPFAWPCELDHRGPGFDAAVPLSAGVTHLALLPHLPGQNPQDLEWVRQVLLPDGLVALELPRLSTAPLRCQGVLRLQEMRLALVRGDGQVVAQGRAELGYFTAVPPPRPKPAGDHGPQHDHSAA